jgi:RND family efflux transporter MFP subunit
MLRIRILMIVILSLIASFSYSGCTKIAEHEAVERIDANTLKVNHDVLENIKTVRAVMTDFPDQLAVMGRIAITEDRTNIVPSRVAGRIEQIYFASGESVHQGQLLATLFSPDFVAAREEYLQSLKQSQRHDQADVSDFTNLTQMSRKKLISMGLDQRDIDAMKVSDLDDSPESPDSIQSKKVSAPPMLNIRAPRSGVIIAKSAVLGNLVNVGDTLFMIGDLSKVWFLGDLYPEDLPKVKKDQEIRVVVPNEKKVLYGKVSFISSVMDPTTRTIKLRALIDNSGLVLRGDMYVQSNLILNHKQALVVPTDAVIRGADKEFVFKRVSAQSVDKTADSVEFKRVQVTLGADQQGMIAINGGLQSGDDVVSDGALLLDEALNTADQSH